ncbi:MAG: transglutaminase domain-containing protein, partial [Acidobacteriota bacterium]
ELNDPQSAFSEPMAAKARELTASAKTEFERIQAVGRYAQSVNYISIQIDLGKGGGYRPHLATDVFAKNYGDCKDKANLMRAMLKSLGIESYPVVIYSGDPNRVQPEWPSPQQFNHCIIAVKVGDATDAATVIKHPQLGRLMIFDPTDDDTPVGDLPDHEQGSYALIAAGEAGDLVKMPSTPPEANRMERSIEAVLGVDGSLNATVRERSFGQEAVDERRLFKRSARPQYNTQIERWITATVPGAKVSKIEPVDGSHNGQFALDVEFESPSYAKSMRGNLLMFKPAIVSRRSSVFLTEAKRTHPVVLSAEAYNETVKIKLPANFVVDEMPEGAEINQPFGSYAVTYEVKDGYLIYKRSLILKSATIPVEQYAAIRNFFGRIVGSEQAPVVLARK